MTWNVGEKMGNNTVYDKKLALTSAILICIKFVILGILMPVNHTRLSQDDCYTCINHVLKDKPSQKLLYPATRREQKNTKKLESKDLVLTYLTDFRPKLENKVHE